jgi:hypothetical protein
MEDMARHKRLLEAPPAEFSGTVRASPGALKPHVKNFVDNSIVGNILSCTEAGDRDASLRSLLLRSNGQSTSKGLHGRGKRSFDQPRAGSVIRESS